MINIVNGGALQSAVFTLYEKWVNIPTAYIFTLTNIATNEVINFTILETLDLSTAKKRYNEFELGSHLATAKAGAYHYFIQDNLDNVLEQGRATITNPTNNLEVTGFNETTTITGYAG